MKLKTVQERDYCPGDTRSRKLNRLMIPIVSVTTPTSEELSLTRTLQVACKKCMITGNTERWLAYVDLYIYNV